ncbi:3'-5' exonuclease [Thermoactinomyces sp. DSM 45892]|uniref:3'-5' exonuclease n=1 Tax=Thermoactinomyces sp. DSM 45892 TaxID=1882753 RepID=UPI00089B1CB2|nr:3'-5' exonuclease [Thermoactinomyces sp. DSM 45892]SDY58094.1 hypothetical protein SAMN05444416_10632 [Thermoactinomyces sp. DSM 45892]
MFVRWCKKDIDLETFKGRVVCPWYDGNGLIYKARILSLGVKYIRDECEALWYNAQEIKKDENGDDLNSYLKENGLTYESIVDIDDDWYEKMQRSKMTD